MTLRFAFGAAAVAAAAILPTTAATAQPVAVQIHGPGWGLRVGPPPRLWYPPRPPLYVAAPPPPAYVYPYGAPVYAVPVWSGPSPVHAAPPVVVVRPWAPPPRWHRHHGYRGG